MTAAQARARIALSRILACIRRRSSLRHAHLYEIVNEPSFLWLAEKADLDPHTTRRAFLEELERVRLAGFGLIGKGRVGGGRRKS